MRNDTLTMQSRDIYCLYCYLISKSDYDLSIPHKALFFLSLFIHFHSCFALASVHMMISELTCLRLLDHQNEFDKPYFDDSYAPDI